MHNHHRAIMQWLYTNRIAIIKTPQKIVFQNYQLYFGSNALYLTAIAFGRFLATQNIKRHSIKIDGKIQKAYDLRHNQTFKYIPTNKRITCPTCRGTGRLTDNVTQCDTK